MNKEEFLKQLEMLLSGISEEERADAMAFYRSYFEDAGEGNEAAILKELETPQKVAESIKKNLGIDGNGGYYNTFANKDAEYYKNVNETVNNLSQTKKETNTTNVTVGIIVAVLLSPIWLTLLIVLACVLLAVVAAILGVAIAVVAVMAALVFTGFIFLGVGFGMLFGGSPAIGIALIGSGLLILALGLLAVIMTVWMFGVVLPWALKGIWTLCKMPFEKRKERAAL